MALEKMKNSFLKNKKGDTQNFEQKMGAKKLLEMRLYKLQQEAEVSLLQSSNHKKTTISQDQFETKFDPAMIPVNRTIL